MMKSKTWILPLGTIYLVLAGAWSAYMIIAHAIPDTSYAITSVAMLALLSTLVPLVLFQIVEFTSSAKKVGGAKRTMVLSMACTAIVVGINVVAQVFRKTLTLQVVPWEILMTYVSVAICEEVYYRLFLVLGIIVLLSGRRVPGVIGTCIVTALAIGAGFMSDMLVRAGLLAASMVVFIAFRVAGGQKNQAPLWATGTAVALSGITFSLAHWGVYAVTQPEMLFVTLAGGIVMAIFLVYSHDAVVPMTAHFINNAMSAGIVFTNATVMLP